jgi:hypothetical protein
VVEILKIHLRDSYGFEAREAWATWPQYYNVFHDGAAIAILCIWPTKVTVDDPRISEPNSHKKPFIEPLKIDFHNPDSFNVLDKKLEEMREYFLCKSA